MLAAKKDKCFKKEREVCGNGFVEKGEECDCGDKCADSKCCNEECKVPEEVECSPQNPIESPCCTDTCEFITADSNEVCFSGSDCQEESVCSGATATCPVPEAKEDNSPCGCQGGNCTANPESATRFCSLGACNVSLCEAYGGVECDLMGEDACELACIGPDWGNNTCTSTFSPDKDPSWPVNHTLYITHYISHTIISLPFFQNGANSGFEMCLSPSTFGAGGANLKKFNPHLIYD